MKIFKNDDTLSVFNKRWKANHNENLNKEIKDRRSYMEKMYGIKKRDKSINNRNVQYNQNSIGKIDNTFFREQKNFYNKNNNNFK